jgi:hypothetical protein
MRPADKLGRDNRRRSIQPNAPQPAIITSGEITRLEVQSLAIDRDNRQRRPRLKAQRKVKKPAHPPCDQWISGSVVEGAPTDEPRPGASNARSQRPATRATGVSRAFACVLNTRGFPQAFYTGPVIHPVRVHNFPLQAS